MIFGGPLLVARCNTSCVVGTGCKPGPHWSLGVPSIVDFSSSLIPRKLKTYLFSLVGKGYQEFLRHHNGLPIILLLENKSTSKYQDEENPTLTFCHLFSISTTGCSTASITSTLSTSMTTK